MDIHGTKDKKVEPIIEPEGYARCPVCGYCDLLPSNLICPKCKTEIDWDWFEVVTINRIRK